MDDLAVVAGALGARLGLTLNGPELTGVLGDAPVTVRVSQHRAQGSSWLIIHASLPFLQRLDAGLQLAQFASAQALRTAGRTGFAERFTADGDDRIGALLTQPVREGLDRCFVGDAGPRVLDTGITWEWRIPTPWPTVDVIGAAIRELPAIWSAIQTAARKVPPRKGTEDAMVELAGLPLPNGVELCGCPAGITGYVGDVYAGLAVAPRTERWPVRVLLTFAPGIFGAPQVVREERFRWYDRLGALMLGRGEVEVGDDRFDRRFAVRTLRPELLEEVLVPEVRARMLALDAIVAIELGPTGIWGHGPVEAVADVTRAARELLALADALGQRRS